MFSLKKILSILTRTTSFLGFLLLSHFACGQTINEFSIATSTQFTAQGTVSQQVYITYNLVHDWDRPFTIDLFSSTDGGSTFPNKLTDARGSLGSGIIRGNGKLIIWDIPSSVTASCLKFQVRGKADVIPEGTMSYNGKTYKTVTLGGQTWMAENLNDKSHTTGTSTSCCYNNYPPYCDNYGRLYNWNAAVSIASKVPGWHLPTNAEWQILIKHLGDKPGKRAKVGGNSRLHFLLAGSRGWGSSDFQSLGSSGYFWSGSLYGGNYEAHLYYVDQSNNFRNTTTKTRNHYSVRLIKD